MICLLGCGLGQFKPNNFGYDISWKVIKHIYIICPFQNYCQLFYIKLVTTTVNEVSTVTNVTPVTYVRGTRYDTVVVVVRAGAQP